MSTPKNILQEAERTELLRFLTAGSVDDGKSTLIGRLLHDSKNIFEDHLAAVERDTVKRGGQEEIPELSLLVDGLRAEREQGITIDVAYRYFSTPRRKFIIADTPGHEQYTRNMATGASTADLAILLVDARTGVITQTKRHSFIASLLGVRHLVVAVNKMDLVDYDQDRYEEIKADYLEFATRLPIHDLHVMPISALKGDNVVDHSQNMPWFTGPCLLHYLETVHVASDRNLIDMRFPVQYVLRDGQDFRGYAGTVASGVLRRGAEVVVLPGRQRTTIERVVTFDGDRDEAFPPMAVTVTLADEIDASRGAVIVYPKNVPHEQDRLDAMVVWMNERPASMTRDYLVKHTTNVVPAQLAAIDYRVDVNSLHREKTNRLELNEIGRVAIDLKRPLMTDVYQRNRATGSFVIIDRLTNETVGAGTIIDRRSREGDELKLPEKATDISPGAVTRAEREERHRRTACVVHLAGSGARQVAELVERKLFDDGCEAIVLDETGTNVAAELCQRGFLVIVIDETSEGPWVEAELTYVNGTSRMLELAGDDESQCPRFVDALILELP